ncbi:HAMP domain-containing sensor histidine kinase [Solwaraspora sp. WMMD1047]|uniref:sensor histidine kinase n=1 Tax=Solwaraspora sp. WMMD1047 TaxID=3016102 RepID=UPI002416185E|nr:HAMP domain-containing sensor histidine kinase [Solwaraspora sp. WMMD1047]MDG4834040.1 HAMP domain-containing sensor histidine kinase [Solwaraspora sp. WMMD1047]
MKRLSLRLRLTLIHGGLVLLAGVLLLGVTYVLVDQRMSHLFGPALPDREVTAELLAERRIAGQDIEQLRQFVQRVQDEARENALNSLLTQGGVALVVVSLIAVAFGWLIAGRSLQPLHQITATARRIAGAETAGRGLHERIALRGPRDEVRELADTFDLMLERLDRSFDGQRRFVANASHELRTPLALNRTLVELAVSRPDAAPGTRQLGETLLAVNARHERLIEGLLTLADSESGLVDRTPVNLAEVAAHVADQAAARLADQSAPPVADQAAPPVADQAAAQAGDQTVAGLAIRRELAPARTVGDPVLLERLTQNLVENAVRHNVAADGWVSVSTGTVDGWALLSVSNSGPVVPPYEVEAIFQPFRRLRQEQVEGRGFGLGLSIVRAVAHAHGGRAVAVPRDGGGLTVTVSLPPASSPAV